MVVGPNSFGRDVAQAVCFAFAPGLAGFVGVASGMISAPFAAISLFASPERRGSSAASICWGFDGGVDQHLGGGARRAGKRRVSADQRSRQRAFGEELELRGEVPWVARTDALEQ